MPLFQSDDFNLRDSSTGTRPGNLLQCGSERLADHPVISWRAWAFVAQARQETALWVCGWYNHRRLHSAIGMVPPMEYELAHATDPQNQPLHD